MLQACGGSDSDPLQRATSFGQVLGSNDSASGTWSWKGIPFAKPPVGAPALEGAGRPDTLDRHACRHQVRQRLPAERPHLRSGQQQHLRQHDRHHAQHAGGQRGLPDAERLAARRRQLEPAGGLLRLRRQRHLGLHRRPGLRRRRPGQVGQRGGRHGQLPGGHAGIHEPGPAQDRRQCRRGLGQFRPARHHPGAEVRQEQHCRRSAAIRATSR